MGGCEVTHCFYALIQIKMNRIVVSILLHEITESKYKNSIVSVNRATQPFSKR